MQLKLMYITNEPDIACIAEKYGVDRIWIDLEKIGKEERQGNMNTVKSHHSIADIAKIKPLLTTSELMVRVNSWHEESTDEIDSVVNAGADIIMLPYWRCPNEVQNFLNAVDGRCKTSLLLETREAVDCIDEVLCRGGFDEIHIGLNDLHLSYGMTFMFELLADGTVERLCKIFSAAKIPYGFGGISRIGDGLLPAEKIIMEHYRLGSTCAILSRSFCNSTKIKSKDKIDCIFKENMKKLREYELTVSNMTSEDFECNRQEVVQAVEGIVAAIKKQKNEETN